MKLFDRLFKRNAPIKPEKSMTLIKNQSDLDYILMDAILIILAEKGQMDVSKLQYELLNCGLMVQQPLLREAIKELKVHKAISSSVIQNLN